MVGTGSHQVTHVYVYIYIDATGDTTQDFTAEHFGRGVGDKPKQSITGVKSALKKRGAGGGHGGGGGGSSGSSNAETRRKSVTFHSK